MRFLFLLLVIALVTVVVLRLVKGIGGALGSRRCPHCGQQVPAVGVYCPICGKRIE